MEIPSQYNPKGIEEKWYRFWLERDYFQAQNNSKKPSYSIVIPPPNITGSLHMGHALNNTIQDIIIRYERMKGFNCLWLPGTDHAGIATQNVVEQMLLKKGITRADLGREEFLKRVWEWKENYGNRISEQLKRLGASCDWSRERFTMDEGLSKAVTEVFVRLYQKNLIYQGNYIINWCPRCETALSDEEAEHQEKEGFLYYIKYPLVNGKGFLTVATTRPETMFGDTAVAVNPKDKRYKNFIGQELRLPLTRRKIPVISHRLVDPDFGSGAVKVTPAHDPNDFLIGKERNLAFITVIDTKGKMNQGAGKFEGLDRSECRKRAIEELKKINLFEKQTIHHHSIGHCYRCNTIIEPYLSQQWFISMKPLAEKAIKEAKNEKPKFYPPRWKKVYLNWLENIQDWCISRQIWWGHRLPVYYCSRCQNTGSSELRVKSLKLKVQNSKFNEGVIVAKEKPEKCPVCGSKNLIQETDVLDTWFSSWLWPFSALGWPKETEDLKRFYPTDTLVTAPEIIFFWVARMVMAGIEFKKKVPFSNVYLHGTVRDAQGRKMSKSLGNAIDPLQIIDDVGTDALRYSIVLITATGQDLFLGKDTFNLGRNFCNKIWNASRFILMNLGENPLPTPHSPLPIGAFSLPQRWILTKLNLLIKDVTNSLDSFRFNEAAHSLYEFFWHQFCDWYLETAKIELKVKSSSYPSPLPLPQGERIKVRVKKEIPMHSELKVQHSLTILADVLENSMKLLHPFIPFITEEVWQRLKAVKSEKLKVKSSGSIMTSEWPKSNQELIDKNSLAQMDVLISLVVAIRDLRARFHLQPSQEITIILVTEEKQKKKTVAENKFYLKALCRLKELKIEKSFLREKLQARSLITGIEIILPLEGVIDLEIERERTKKEIRQIEEALKATGSKLTSKNFLKKAPQPVVLKEKEKEKSFREKLKKLKETADFIR
ncbi:MAG: valine--tRNA ligase [bacterium (Candidatus Ratteibacteria) CG01_land_8_20_14_3_00_40_19]|uniref:Valine--tRNA ligase n=1 Tax=bacterium (Candidatus Ratteibacteria) CG01_land_8_20_14_3_00_40_19 TaxID=2014290 RepID=A0A2M7E9V6_9BACT|nr:MAG: valine--tRNA ligase [Candidatus Omnitrophica bacterium CG1_02_41_171]PIV64488.1 MAG: valine--tRNA ligase [bacterium (Candidatus Ratteibacteria) CG01_land_8_20_14_3_00_40_19]HCG76287.1 valine--tRNA ligase [bacterium]